MKGCLSRKFRWSVWLSNLQSWPLASKLQPLSWAMCSLYWLWFTKQIHCYKIDNDQRSIYTNYYRLSARRQHNLLWESSIALASWWLKCRIKPAIMGVVWSLNMGIVKGCGSLSQISIQKSWKLWDKTNCCGHDRCYFNGLLAHTVLPVYRCHFSLFW
jgi:hypothetical protein